MKCLTLLTVVSFTLSALAFAASQPRDSQEFLKELHTGNQAEIAVGKLAEKKGASKGVRDFGKKLVQDHKDFDQKIVNLAKQENMDLGQPELNKDQKDLEQKLQAANGKDFDRIFLEGMTSDHKKDIEKVRTAQLDDPRAQKLARDALPTLEKHYAIAEGLQKTVAQ